jgi:uncharacterized protein (TIGR03435 family)
LVIAKGGPKLKESKTPDNSASGVPQHRLMMARGNGSVEAQSSSINNLLEAISPEVGRTIVDKTGLAAYYDYTLKWTPDDGRPPMPGDPSGGPPRGDAAPTSDAGGPSLFTALQEQLGLKLESQKGPVDVIVIDHIDPPSPN